MMALGKVSVLSAGFSSWMISNTAAVVLVMSLFFIGKPRDFLVKISIAHKAYLYRDER